MTQAPQEIAPGVHCLEVGRGIMRSNVYFVRSGESWTLVDAGSKGCGPVIQAAAEALFGEGARPASILLTHDHADHGGAAMALARLWDLPVYVHPDEMKMVRGDMATFREYANPLDRWMILPILRAMGKRRYEAIMAEASIEDVAQPLEPEAGLPGLPDWEAVPTPGHTPGHLALFRPADCVLISGDAILTINVNSPLTLIRRRQQTAPGPWYTTWDRHAAKESIAALARLEPRVLAGGHGVPMSGPGISAEIKALSDRL